MVFQCINIRQVPCEVLKTAAFGLGFQHLPRDVANVNALKTMFDPYINLFLVLLVSRAIIIIITTCLPGVKIWYLLSRLKLNKETQELIQSDPHQATNTKGKERQIQLSSHKVNRWQAELATFSQQGGNSAT